MVSCTGTNKFKAIFFSAAAASGSFGGLLAAAIESMDGIGGRPGWAWIFILEGLLTVLAGFASFYMVLDFPHETSWLSEGDRQIVMRRLNDDQRSYSGEPETFKWAYVWQAVADWKTWLGMAIYMGCDMPLYAFSLFLPSIVQSLGWNTSTVRSQLMSAPPYLAAAIVTVAVGWAADRKKRRGLFNVISSVVSIVGFAMLLGSSDPAVQYAGVFLGALGIYPTISNTISWVANNTEGVYKRGVVLGFVIGWGNMNGIVSANIYYREPDFAEGHGVVLAYLAIFLCLGSLVMSVLLGLENRRRGRGERTQILEGKSEEEKEMLGDMHPDFVYML